MNITLNKGGTGERTVAVESIEIPDVWHVAMYLKAEGLDDSSERVLKCWHRAHDMKNHLLEAA